MRSSSLFVFHEVLNNSSGIALEGLLREGSGTRSIGFWKAKESWPTRFRASR